MAVFTPNSSIYLISDVPIDNTYRHTIDFANQTEQLAYFQGKAVTELNLTSYKYLRKDKSITVSKRYDSLLNVNYILYRNNVEKWIFCFITDKKYVNETATELIVETDVLQTYMFDYQLKHSFIEREHVANDNIGAHLMEENLYCGDEYAVVSKSDVSELKDLVYIVATTVDDTLADVRGTIQTGIYSGLAYYACQSAVEINNIINALDAAGKGEALKCIFTVPKALVDLMSGYPLDMPFPEFISKSYSKNLGNLDGYTPKNNKLFCYPYNFMEVSNNKGASTVIRYEDSETTNIDFQITCNLAPNPVVCMYPTMYKNETNNSGEMITLSDYPLCTWTNDVYSNWLAQNQVSNVLGVASSVLSLGAGVATGNPLAIGGGIIGVANSIGTFHEKALLPNPLKGSSSGGANIAAEFHTFTVRKKTVKAEFAKMIDNYFTLYGYKVNDLKVPNVKTRPYYNYIKTIGANLTGNFDQVDLDKLRSIYDNGVTFWHYKTTGFNPLDYSVTNK